MIELSQKYLKSILHYEPETGYFTWISPTRYHPRMKGKSAGCNTTGYTIIKVDGKKYKAHKLAWLYVYGHIPNGNIDHWDTNTFNNAIGNLRLCSNAQNQANKRRIKGKALPKGVRKMGSGFSARISFNKQQLHLGGFPSIEGAEAAYFAKAQELYGQFARRD